MTSIIISAIKYINIILICLYAFFSFRIIGKISEKQKNRYMIYGNLSMVLILTFSYAAIYLSVYEDKIIIFYGAIMAYFLVTKAVLKIFYESFRMPLINNMQMFMTIGFSMLARLSYTKAIKQFVVCVFITMVAMFVPKIIEKAVGFRKYCYVYAVLGVLSLAAVLMFGSYVYGAKLNLSIGGLTVQPSEFVKISFVLFLAAILSRKGSFKNVIISGVIAALHVGILVLSRDLGTALIFCVVYVFIVYIATAKSIYLFGGLLMGSAAAFVAYTLFDHVATRVEAFLNPWPLIDNKGYQITQSLFAIATGGNFGMGINQGMPQSIPVVEEDFIFSAICEEYGVLFGIGLILVIVSTFMIFIKLAFECKDNFYKLMVAGFGVLFVFQVFLTIGGAIKFIPSTGVTLPFISYGRTSQVAMVMMFFMTVGIALKQQQIHRIKKNEVVVIKQTNKFALRTTVIFSVLLGAMTVYLFVFSTFMGEDIINNPYNKRYQVLENKINKGDILSADGKILAETLVADDNTTYRNYPYGEVFAHVVGRTEYGLDGLEALYNYDLLEENTNIFYKLYCELNNIKLQGNDIITSMNTDIQVKAYEALEDNKGAVLVLDAATGEILASVSKPSYNPNAVIEDWELLNTEENSQLLNRATNGLYTPGSVFKIFTMLEYINENEDAYEDYVYNCEGTTDISGFNMQCSYKTAHGECNLKKSLAKSCNCSFVNIGKQLSLNGLNSLCSKLLFNTDLKLDFPTENSIFSISDEASLFDMAQTVIGQGKTLVTPLHIGIIMSAIANEGVAMKPHFVTEITDYSGRIVEDVKAEEYKTLFDESDAELLKEYMREVVLSGTAKKLNSSEYTAYGKTGTAQIDEKGHANSWFAGFIEKGDFVYTIVVVAEGVDENTFPAVDVAKQIADVLK